MSGRDGKRRGDHLASPSPEKKRDRSADGHKHKYCCCRWDDCQNLNQAMAEIDPIFKGCVATTTAPGHRSRQLVGGIIRHLRPANRGMHYFYVARHHLHVDLLKKHTGEEGGAKRNLATPIDKEEAERVGIFEHIDRYLYEDGLERNRNNGIVKYVQVPNVTREAVKGMIKDKATAPPPKHFADVVVVEDIPDSPEDARGSSDKSQGSISDGTSTNDDDLTVERLKEMVAKAEAQLEKVRGFEDENDIIAQAYATDSIKKFQGKTSTSNQHSARRKKKKGNTKTPNNEMVEDNGDDDENDEETLDEIYSTDSLKLKRLKKVVASPSVPEGSSGSRGKLDATDEGLRSFRLEREQQDQLRQKRVTSKQA